MKHLELSKQHVKVCDLNLSGRSDGYGNTCVRDYGRCPYEVGRDQNASHFDLTLEPTERTAIGPPEACVHPPQELAKTADDKASRPRTGSAALKAPVAGQSAKTNHSAKGGHYARPQP